MVMKLKATASKGGDFEYPEPGNQAAVLVAIVDLGTVNKEFQGKAYDAREVYLVWELPTQQMTGSTFNHVIGKVFSLSFGEKSNLRKMVAKWRGSEFREGDEFDLSKLLGLSCLLDVQPVEGKSYVKLDATPASRLPKGMSCPPAKRSPVCWDIEEHDELPEHLDWLPFIYGESVCDRIKRSAEWREKLYADSQGVNGKSGVGDDEGEIPIDTSEDAPF